MHNSVVPPRRISLQAQPQFSLDESLKMIATRIQQTKDEIEKLQEKMDQFQPNKANTTTQKQYFQERRKFIFTNIQMLQRHLGKLIQNQAILKGDGITETDLKSMVQVLEQLSQEGIEIMKSCLDFNNLNPEQPIPKEFQLVSERMQRDYTVQRTEEDLDKQVDGLNNYFQNEIKKFYKNPEKAPYLQYIVEQS